MKIKKKTLLHTAATAIIFMTCLLMPVMCLADLGEWTWRSGSNQINEAGDYGTITVPASANVPGAREDSCSWTDASGDLWLFGGIDFNGDVRNDLWRYEPDNGADGTWTWMRGANVADQPGSYGTLRVPGAANTPGARSGAVCWIDSSGDLWLFGGYGLDGGGTYDWLNDIWRYETSTNQWAWEDGLPSINIIYEKGHYTDPGYPDPNDWPGAREGAISWTDSFGFMWMFGGYGYQDIEYYDYDEDDGTWCWDRTPYRCPDPGVLNDLWTYNKVTHEWAWVSGSDNTNQNGIYGIMGEATFDNVPGARVGSIPWIDNDNNLWLFGGAGKDSNVPDGFIRRMTDLWRYDPVTKMWTFVNGFEVGDQPGVYDESIGALLPGCREESISWIDNDDNLWLLGGFGLASTYSPIGGLLNDLWRYDIAANQWKWVSGSDEISNPGETIIAGVYGTKGEADALNVTGARQGAIPWIDSLGSLWLFGGVGFDGGGGTYGSMNDLWSYEIPACVSNSDCYDEDFCNGFETCEAGVCAPGGGDPCSGDTPECDEVNDICVECLAAVDCPDDGEFCTGAPLCTEEGVCGFEAGPCTDPLLPVCDEENDECINTCSTDEQCFDDDLYCTGDPLCTDDGECGFTGNPCGGNTPACDEENEQCALRCLSDDECADDNLWCTGPPVCTAGVCEYGAGPCSGGTPACDEQRNLCSDICLSNEQCADDYLFCTGDPICEAGVCGFTGSPCGGNTPACSESNDQCLEGCLIDDDCVDALFCTGDPVCTDGECEYGPSPCSGTILPVCDEANNECIDTCLTNEQCSDDYLYCTGDPICTAGVCGFTGSPCGGNTPACYEGNDRCVLRCLADEECVDDDLFCTGAPVCTAGECGFAEGPCSGATPICDEQRGQCVELCLTDDECVDDDLFCTGAAVCLNDGSCGFEAGPCGGDTPACDEANDQCVAVVTCLEDSECADDNLFCTGDPLCTDAGECGFSGSPCSGDTPVCDEVNDQCIEGIVVVNCEEDSECADDDLFCTGESLCTEEGVCGFSGSPCSTEFPACDEMNDQCVERCLADSECIDDDLFCTGDPICTDGECGFAASPCSGETPACDEEHDQCVQECFTDGDCDDDDLFCTGVPFCSEYGWCWFAKGPCSGDNPACDEQNDTCKECIYDSHCDDGYKCTEEAVCVAKCHLVIKKNAISAAKLWKERKKTFKIITSSFGDVDMGPDIQILKIKPNTKNGKVKVKTIVPAGLRPQIIPVWVGECSGEIVITP